MCATQFSHICCDEIILWNAGKYFVYPKWSKLLLPLKWCLIMVIYSLAFNILGAYKLLEDFAKPYFHKYWTEMHDVTTIWKRNVWMFTSHHFQRHYQNCESASTPQSGTSHKTCLRGFGGNGSIAWTLLCHTWGAHKMHLRSLWNCKHSSFKW